MFPPAKNRSVQERLNQFQKLFLMERPVCWTSVSLPAQSSPGMALIGRWMDFLHIVLSSVIGATVFTGSLGSSVVSLNNNTGGENMSGFFTPERRERGKYARCTVPQNNQQKMFAMSTLSWLNVKKQDLFSLCFGSLFKTSGWFSNPETKLLSNDCSSYILKHTTVHFSIGSDLCPVLYLYLLKWHICPWEKSEDSGDRLQKSLYTQQ